RRQRPRDDDAGAAPPVPVFPIGLVCGWVAALGALVIGLALRGVGTDPAGPWWSAGAVLAASATVGAVGVWLRREGWGLGACLGVNLALSLVVWHLHRDEPLADWWVELAQANVLASAAAALFWLAGRRVHGAGRGPLRSTPLLNVQVAAGLLGSLALLVGPAV